ncbi:2-polyprenyl-6-methoxyphenol hydroxylase-like FAD-dependent oxidoreductase [Asanoa ferruginea]|uniref:2-polyprenyl-6-methoxyphenol hydroxylase-like FAD-dependent oxidoreductase n=1 Tax=Asanoa ferruginea TaxID=53367 RepID=A0A3D9ZW56_9ACTN|nr:FAD-dependent monooxygenase [Asanoa ferruginea]REG01240.1 2-polyprenyl-6-methoxyphenol hydroxylase-like FAD-dependent oxidoreductase [Asanoa ferruginea]GIF53059.1 FAD-dependent oxidoreductase [Asanoa ferruginea]
MDAEVVVVGAGPVGLLLALELVRGGVDPIVVEALPQPSDLPKANGVVGRAVPVLHSRGLYRELTGRRRLRAAPRFMYGGFAVDLRRLRDNPVHILPVPQRRLEAVLAARALSAGVDIRRGHTVTGLSQDSAGVTVAVDGPSGAYTLRCAHLVGCDGAHSAVRKAAGIGFPGAVNDAVVSRSAHVVLPAGALTPFGGRLRAPGGPYRPYLFHRTPHGVFSFARFKGAPHLVTTLEWSPSDDSVPMTVGELRASLGRVLGQDLAIAPPSGAGPYVLRRAVARHSRVADRYQAGRVLLAGDAAHVVAGIGGPALNLGMLDAVDLAGRLLGGGLEGYDQARRPYAERVLAHAAEQSALLGPGPSTDAQRERFAARLATEAGLRSVAEAIAGG